MASQKNNFSLSLHRKRGVEAIVIFSIQKIFFSFKESTALQKKHRTKEGKTGRVTPFPRRKKLRVNLQSLKAHEPT
jgi:hypothetical protein